MKVLSDNTADRILRHLAGDGTPPRAMTPRAAPSSEPARLWQIHVVPATGEVTVDAGRAMCEDGWHEVAPSSPGIVEGGEYVVCSIGEDGPAVSLAADLADVSEPFAVIGRVLQGGDSAFFVEQYVSNPIILHRHWGDAEEFVEIGKASDEWAARPGDPRAQGVALPVVTLLEKDSDGKITDIAFRTVTFDEMGNAVHVAGEKATPDPSPGKPDDSAPPACGNPLNEADDSNPLDVAPGGGGGERRDDDDDHNPLDYEGDGGFTPTCGGEAA